MSTRFKPFVVIVVSLLLAATVAARGKVDLKTAPEHTSKAQDEVVWTDLTTITDPVIFWPTLYGVQQTGMLNTTFNCYGLYGSRGGVWSPNQALGWPNAAFETPPGSDKEYLYCGALWIGAIMDGDTLVSTGCDGWTRDGHEFRPPQYPVGSITKFDYPTDFSMRSVYTDTCEYLELLGPELLPHVPLNLHVSNRSHVWRNTIDEDIVIYDLAITNIGDQFLEKVYVGHYFDTDVGWDGSISANYLDDLVGSLREHGIGYAIDNDGDPTGTVYNPLTDARKIIALKLVASSHPIADTNFNWWTSNGSATFDFGPRLLPTPDDPYFDFGTGGLGTPEADSSKYYVLSHGEWDYDQVYTGSIGPDDPLWMTPPGEIADDYAMGSDSKFVLSYGPFDILPGASIRLVFAMFTADNVHNFPLAAYLFLPDMPDDYVNALNFDDVLTNSARADELVAGLLDPMLPVQALEVTYQDMERSILEWDPWVFDNIDSYELFLSEIPAEEIPYPGVVPPWLTTATPDYMASVTPNTYSFEEARTGAAYFAKVAHRTSSDVGQTSEPVLIDYRVHTPPEVTSQAAVYNLGCSSDLSPTASAYPTIRWSPPSRVSADRYNIYRFDNTDELATRYYPFYDEGLYKDVIVPRDTFEIGDKTYYFYAMDVYAEVGGGVHEFTDTESFDGAIYIVTAVNSDGLESLFSEPVTSYEVGCFDRDILVLTNPGCGWAATDSIRIFYEDLLDGYEYGFYSFPDTVVKYECSYRPEDCIQWQDFTNYKLLILEEDSYRPFFTETFESRSNGIANYLTCGGRLAYFGGFEGFNSYDRYDTAYYTADYDFINRFFGIDSIFYYGFCYYGVYPTGPKLDTSFGFIEAQAEIPAWPDVHYDQNRNPYSDMINMVWGYETPPSVATFAVNDMGEVSHTYKTLYPETSLVDGQPVGVTTKAGGAKTYLFGFHLWYMERESARSLVDAIFRGLPGGSGSKDGASLPDELVLSQNYPNPFNPSTVVQFSLPRATKVTLEIYNVLGQRVNTLINGRMLQAGSHSIEWHSDNDGGSKVSSGIYFCRLRAGDRTATKKMMLLK